MVFEKKLRRICGRREDRAVGHACHEAGEVL
jgi:hypothetical protein